VDRAAQSKLAKFRQQTRANDSERRLAVKHKCYRG
jgi:hypothetical protein